MRSNCSRSLKRITGLQTLMEDCWPLFWHFACYCSSDLVISTLLTLKAWLLLYKEGVNWVKKIRSKILKMSQETWLKYRGTFLCCPAVLTWTIKSNNAVDTEHVWLLWVVIVVFLLILEPFCLQCPEFLLWLFHTCIWGEMLWNVSNFCNRSGCSSIRQQHSIKVQWCRKHKKNRILPSRKDSLVGLVIQENSQSTQSPLVRVLNVQVICTLNTLQTIPKYTNCAECEDGAVITNCKVSRHHYASILLFHIFRSNLGYPTNHIWKFYVMNY